MRSLQFTILLIAFSTCFHFSQARCNVSTCDVPASMEAYVLLRFDVDSVENVTNADIAALESSFVEAYNCDEGGDVSKLVDFTIYGDTMDYFFGANYSSGLPFVTWIAHYELYTNICQESLFADESSRRKLQNQETEDSSSVSTSHPLRGSLWESFSWQNSDISSSTAQHRTLANNAVCNCVVPTQQEFLTALNETIEANVVAGASMGNIGDIVDVVEMVEAANCTESVLSTWLTSSVITLVTYAEDLMDFDLESLEEWYITWYNEENALNPDTCDPYFRVMSSVNVSVQSVEDRVTSKEWTLLFATEGTCNNCTSEEGLFGPSVSTRRLSAGASDTVESYAKENCWCAAGSVVQGVDKGDFVALLNETLIFTDVAGEYILAFDEVLHLECDEFHEFKTQFLLEILGDVDALTTNASEILTTVFKESFNEYANSACDPYFRIILDVKLEEDPQRRFLSFHQSDVDDMDGSNSTTNGTEVPSTSPTVGPTMKGPDLYTLLFEVTGVCTGCSDGIAIFDVISGRRLGFAGADAPQWSHGRALGGRAGVVSRETGACYCTVDSLDKLPDEIEFLETYDEVLQTFEEELGSAVRRINTPTMAPTTSVAPSATPSTSAPSHVPSSLPTLVRSSEPSLEASHLPTNEHSLPPSSFPTQRPVTDPPTSVPTFFPTKFPTPFPTPFPTTSPTSPPSSFPSTFPSSYPSSVPTSVHSQLPTAIPTQEPTNHPTGGPTPNPSAAHSSTPTISNVPTSFPSSIPTVLPTSEPSHEPSTAKPSIIPSGTPTEVSSTQPTDSPSAVPSQVPTAEPSLAPSGAPTNSPKPSSVPSGKPTTIPSALPSLSPTGQPSMVPTRLSSEQPSTSPSSSPTSPFPSLAPSDPPTQTPSEVPSDLPTETSDAPSDPPTETPSDAPSDPPTETPSDAPSDPPTETPSDAPSDPPTEAPSDAPSDPPTEAPSDPPTETPSLNPSTEPSLTPSDTPTNTRCHGSPCQSDVSSTFAFVATSETSATFSSVNFGEMQLSETGDDVPPADCDALNNLVGATVTYYYLGVGTDRGLTTTTATFRACEEYKDVQFLRIYKSDCYTGNSCTCLGTSIQWDACEVLDAAADVVQNFLGTQMTLELEIGSKYIIEEIVASKPDVVTSFSDFCLFETIAIGDGVTASEAIVNATDGLVAGEQTISTCAEEVVDSISVGHGQFHRFSPSSTTDVVWNVDCPEGYKVVIYSGSCLDLTCEATFVRAEDSAVSSFNFATTKDVVYWAYAEPIARQRNY